jgi:tetratricopeptide (TPR) repeat protein
MLYRKYEENCMSERTNRKGTKATNLSVVAEWISTRGILMVLAASVSLAISMPLAAQEAVPDAGGDQVPEPTEDIIQDTSEEVTGVVDEPLFETDTTDTAAVLSEDPGSDSNDTNINVSEPEVAQQSLIGVDLSTYESPLDPINTYLDAIDAAEIANGAYATDLADLYLGLGQVYMESREFEEAKQVFQQGMQIMRVNYGLNSPEQTNYLFAVADIESMQGNRRSANKVISHVYLINAKNYGLKSPEMIPVLTQILEWYQHHRPAEAPENFYEDLERAGSITSEMAEIIELDKGLGHPDTTAMYRKQGQIHWHTAKYVLGRGISVEPGVIMATGKPSYSVHVKEVSIKEHFTEGREAFTKVAESVNLDENSSMIERAEAIAQLGDWNLAFGKKQAAGDAYIRAYIGLEQESQSKQVADDYFRYPIPVRFMDDTLQSHESDIETDVFITTTLTVTEGGRSLNIELIDPPEQIPSERLRMIKRELNSMHFRPALGGGVPVRTEGFVFEFPLTLTAEES